MQTVQPPLIADSTEETNENTSPRNQRHLGVGIEGTRWKSARGTICQRVLEAELMHFRIIKRWEVKDFCMSLRFCTGRCGIETSWTDESLFSVQPQMMQVYFS